VKKLKLLCLIFVTLITLFSVTGCCSLCEPVIVEADPPILPPKPERVVLVDDGNINEYRLMVQDARWMMWSSFVEWKLGLITEDEYNADVERLEGLIAEYDKIFQIYLDSLAEP